MLALIRVAILGIGVACAGAVLASPRAESKDAFKAAEQLEESGDLEGALAAADTALSSAPADLRMLALKARVQGSLRDYAGALATYERCLAAGASGALRRNALKQVERLRVALETILEVTVSGGAANGPTTVYLDSKTKGVFCTAAPSCNKDEFPGDYKVIAERAGFERWTGPVTLERGKTVKLAITLVDQPSLLTVRVAQPDASVSVDGTSTTAPTKVAGGSHQVVVTLAGYGDERFEVIAGEGKDIVKEVSLTPLVPIAVTPAGATLQLDGRPVVAGKDGLLVPRGSRVLVARAAGFKDRRIDIPAERPATYQLTVTLEPVPSRVPTSGSRTSRMFTRNRKLALVAGGVGVVAGVSGVVLGLRSSALEDDALELCPVPTDCATPQAANDLNERAQTRALQANIAYGVAGAAAVGAAVLWLTGAPESRERAAQSSNGRRFTVTPRFGAVSGLELTGRF